MHGLRSLSSRNGLFVLTFVLCVLDRALKIWAIYSPLVSVRMIPGVLHLEFSLNTHAAFSIQLPASVYVVLLTISAILLAYVWYVHKGFAVPLLRVAGVCIMLGALSNVYDRIMYGGVIDMLAVPGLGACNLADVYIVCGVLAWLWWSMMYQKIR